METLNEILLNLDENSPMTNKEIAIKEMREFEISEKRKWMDYGEKYYKNKVKIIDHKRMAISENGLLREVTNLSNNKLVHSHTRKLVDQKVGYLLGKPMSIQTDGPDAYEDALKEYFGKQFHRQLKNLGKNAVNAGISWLHPYYDEEGQFKFRVIPSMEGVPIWKDTDHTELDAFIRFYDQDLYVSLSKKTVTVIELWTVHGVMKFTLDKSIISSYREFDDQWNDHFTFVTKVKNDDGVEEVVETQGLNWEKVPFIPFKYNDEEMPLVESIKSLVDDYDSRASDNANNLEDSPESILILKGYGGTDLGVARRNLRLYRMAEVAPDGGLDSLDINIDTTAVTSHLERERKAIYEFGRGVDTQSDKFGNSPSGIALRFLYSDLDMDANIIETEFQSSMEQLLWFVNQHLKNTTDIDYSEFDVDFIFNRDIPINETEAIKNIKESVGLLSDETLTAQHPWVTDVPAEMERKEAEANKAMEEAANQQFKFDQAQAALNPPTPDDAV